MRAEADGDRQQFAREAAERAQARHDAATAGLARLAERSQHRDDALIRREIRNGADEMARFERDQRGDERLDAGDEAAFMRAQLIPMLEDGWSPEELEDVGITRETLASLGILHHLKH